ncbi:TIGR00730 family Rossman fold protein [uncultured Methanobrevibacter sp.]|uniref:LOG family protein n=1 Tax=uncultured Methanobrevibacter sp. TaxID=253161 RepID=UPI0025DA1455|nr:TIGR00730 family Rossman fold protein [uncultured Methanobrevibacter sp.]MCI6993493.1 TIGR00730 family Rossman fold protein [Methanobrevibacter sp.]
MRICLYGSGSRKIDEIYTDVAYELGTLIAQKGHTLVFGGGNTGMMGACAHGVHDNNGKSIGIAPEWIGNFEPICQDCSEFIYVDTMDERKNKFVENSDAFIISPGGIGTLDEFFEIITLRKLKRHNKEIVIFNINGFYDTMIKMIDEMSEKGFLYKQTELFKVTDNVEEIFEYLE